MRYQPEEITVRIAKRLSITYLVCATVFAALMVLVYHIPNRLMTVHLQQSLQLLLDEGQYRQIVGGAANQTPDSHTIDNFTVAIMLNEAGHGDDDPLTSAFANPRVGEADNDEIARLFDALDKKENATNVVTYERYWHGYLVFLKPLLLAFNLGQIRQISMAVFVGMLGLAVILLARREGPLAGLALLLTFVAVNYQVAIYSLSLSACLHISIGAVLFVILRTESRSTDSDSLVEDFAAPFFVVGGLTAYFDFLCTPVMTVGVPLVVLLYLCRRDITFSTCLRVARDCLLLSVFWALGYGLLWATKWLLATIVLRKNILAVGLDNTQKWADTSSTLASHMGAGPLESLRFNRTVLFNKWTLTAAGAAAVLLVPVIWFARSHSEEGGASFAWLLPGILVAAYPYIWYAIISVHSYVHYWFTYRSQAVTILAALLAVAAILEPRVRLRGRSEVTAS